MTLIGPNARNAWAVTNGVVDLRRPVREQIAVPLPARPQGLVVDLARAACVIVDMQNDFCARGGWLDYVGVDISGARSVIKPIAALLPLLRRAGVPLVWLNWGNRPDRANLPPGVLHVYNPDGHSIGIGGRLPVTGSRVLEAGSWSADTVDGLVVEPGDISVAKYRMSGFVDTELDSVLRNLAVTTVFFAGVNMDQCVFATLMDAACLGYDVVLLRDCAGTTSPEFCRQATLYNVERCFGFIANGADLAAAITGLEAR